MKRTNNMHRWKTWAVTAAASFLVLAGCANSVQNTGTQAQGSQKEEAVPAYPTRQIEYVVPFAAGGGVDLVARAVAEYASKEWGQPVVVVNKTGGAGATGAQYALKQQANDGYTVLANNVSNTSMLVGGLADPPVKIEDHKWISRIVQDAPAYIVKADAPWKDLKELSEWVKQHPEQLTWTSVGPAGFSAFVAAEWLGSIGVDYSKTRMVTTKGTAESLPMVAGGNAVLALHTVGEVYSLVKAGKLKILAVQSPERSPYFPDVPTTKEQGFDSLTVSWWTGLSVAAGTPDYVVKKWDALIAKASKDPVFINQLKNIQVVPAYLGADAFAAAVKKETETYIDLATKRGIRK
jgi:tripartite-type tricarboxylate transporter receptor subunit TctC